MAWLHNGVCPVVLCAAWQKMQTSVWVFALTVPGPVTERLCLELTTVLADAAVGTNAARSAAQASKLTRLGAPASLPARSRPSQLAPRDAGAPRDSCSPIKVRLFMARPGIQTLARGDCKSRPRKSCCPPQW